MPDLAGIHALLEQYFDALHASDAKLLAGVMHPRAIYVTADEQPAVYRTMDEYLPIVAARQSPLSRGEPRRDIIESIDLAGDNTGFARVCCSIGTRDFTDFLSLVCTGGEWKIVAKVFHFIEREESCRTSTSR